MAVTEAPAPRRSLKTLFVAFCILLVAAIVLYLCLTSIGLEEKTAITAATGLFSAITFLQQVLDTELKGFSLLPSKLVTFEGYTIPWPQMVLYCSIILMATQSIGSLAIGFLSGAAEVRLDRVPIVLGIILPILMAAVVFFLARWVGRRTAGRPTLVALLFIALSMTGIRLMDDFLFGGAEARRAMGIEMSGTEMLGFSLGLFVWLSIFGLLGVWRGHKARLSGYLAYLLGIVPRDTRETLIDLAYEEAAKLGAPQSAAAVHVLGGRVTA